MSGQPFSKSKLLITSVLAVAVLLVAGTSHAAGSFVLDRTTVTEKARWNSISRSISESKKGIRVLWWNIANGASEADPESLTSNLEILVTSKLAPDVIALGEFSEKALPETTFSQISQRYPIRQFIRYNPLTSTGIAVFSRLPMKTVRMGAIDWIPDSFDDAAIAKYRSYWAEGSSDGGDGFYVRPVREIHVLGRERLISFTPLHLAEPWRDLGKQSDGKIDYVLSTMSELYFGTTNPLITQIDFVTKWLEDGVSKDRLVVGDLNLPRSFVGVPTLGYRRLSRVMRSAITSAQNSFPTPSSPHSFPPMQLDHAFIGGSLRAPVAGVLPLKGSDHYPVYVIVN